MHELRWRRLRLDLNSFGKIMKHYCLKSAARSKSTVVRSMQKSIRQAKSRPLALVLAAFSAFSYSAYSSHVVAQTAAAEPAGAEITSTEKAQPKLSTVIVIGNPLDARDVVAPISILTGVDLLLKKASTLGETVNGLPGVSSTYFGPNASRPTIRGLDGDRIRILSNLGASLDASSLSFDHNPSIDPLVIERIEVLRGPAVLLYGGTAIGGVVNVVDNRIPRDAVSGISGSFETRFGGAERERGNSVVLETGSADKNHSGGFSLHLDGFQRTTEDYKVPGGTGLTSPIINSAAESKGGAAGASYAFQNSAVGSGYVGLSQSNYQSIYGTVAEAAVKINMRQNRTSFEANLNQVASVINGVFIKASHSDYQHTEFADGVPTTTFKNNGSEFRVELKHARFGLLQGVVGFQGERFDFSALGAEAFVPMTKTTNSAVFLFEEIDAGAVKYSFGARAERSKAESSGAGNGGVARFGEAVQRSFNLASGSVGAQWKLDPAYTLTSNLSAAERAPTFYELYANGPHGATAAYEVGDKSQSKERSTAIDLALRWKQGATSTRIGVFAQQFKNYIAQNRTGVNRDSEGNGAVIGVTDCGGADSGKSIESGCTADLLPEFRFQGVTARFTGFEWEGTWRLVEKPYTLDWEAKADYVRAEDRTNQQPLPRIAPRRFTTGLIFAQGGWSVRGEIDNRAKQTRVPTIDAIGATAGYTMINAAGAYGFNLGSAASGTLFLRGTNLTDRKAYSASSTDTIRALAPYPGRGIKAGVQISF